MIKLKLFDSFCLCLVFTFNSWYYSALISGSIAYYCSCFPTCNSQAIVFCFFFSLAHMAHVQYSKYSVNAFIHLSNECIVFAKQFSNGKVKLCNICPLTNIVESARCAQCSIHWKLLMKCCWIVDDSGKLYESFVSKDARIWAIWRAIELRDKHTH